MSYRDFPTAGPMRDKPAVLQPEPDFCTVCQAEYPVVVADIFRVGYLRPLSTVTEEKIRRMIDRVQRGEGRHSNFLCGDCFYELSDV